MEYRILKKYLDDNKNMTITKLSKNLNVSRQTIYDWNEKGVIPKKYEDAISKIMFIGDEIDCKIEFEISYNDLSSIFLILDNNYMIILEDNNLIFVIIDEYGERKIRTIGNKNYDIKSIKGNYEFGNLNHLKLNIFRYETDIDYVNKRIKYILYCSTTKKRKYFMSPLNKNIFLMMKNRLELNIDENLNFKDIVNYVKFNELDMVILVNREEMKVLSNDLSCDKDFDNSILELMGMFLRYDDALYTYLIRILGNKFERIIEYYKGNYEYLNIIFICMDNIKSNLKILRTNYLNEFKDISLTIRDDLLLLDNNDLLKIVFAHECGHLVFSYNISTDRSFEERRANYFVSFIFDGKYDYFNLFLTSLQPWIYRNPLVKPDIEIIYNLAFHKISNSQSLKKLFNEYYKEVDKLYENSK